MLFILRATIPNSAGNKLVKGNFEATFGKIMGDLKPEAAYFAVDKGQRTLFLVVNVDKASDLPRQLEPLWLALEADVEVIPAMSASEFGEAGPGIAAVVARY